MDGSVIVWFSLAYSCNIAFRSFDSKVAARILLTNDAIWLFPSENGKHPMRDQSIDKAVRRTDDEIFKKAKIKHFTPHDLRRTAYAFA
jgi:integrase